MLQNVAQLAVRDWVISYANEREDSCNYFWEGVEIFRIWATTHSLVFSQCLETVMAPLGVSFHLLIEDQGLVLSAALVLCDSNWFMFRPRAMPLFEKLCPAPFPPVTKGGMVKTNFVAISELFSRNNESQSRWNNVFKVWKTTTCSIL